MESSGKWNSLKGAFVGRREGRHWRGNHKLVLVMCLGDWAGGKGRDERVLNMHHMADQRDHGNRMP